jgi:hypothetical protein
MAGLCRRTQVVDAHAAGAVECRNHKRQRQFDDQPGKLAEKLTIWEDSSVLAKDCAEELIGLVLRYYLHGLDTKEGDVHPEDKSAGS